LIPATVSPSTNEVRLGRKKGDLESALNDFTDAIKFDPENSTAYSNRGRTWLKKGEVDKAIADFGEAISLSPKYAMAYYRRCLCWREKGETDIGMKDYKEAITLDPGILDNYLSEENRGEPQATLDKAIFQSFAAYGRGIGWQVKGKFENALEELQQACQLDPNNAGACNDLAWLKSTCYVDRIRNGKEAVEYATKACELTAWESWQNLDTLAAAHAETGNFGNAIQWQEKAIEFVPTSKRRDFSERLKLYREYKPYREAWKAPPDVKLPDPKAPATAPVVK